MLQEGRAYFIRSTRDGSTVAVLFYSILFYSTFLSIYAPSTRMALARGAGGRTARRRPPRARPSAHDDPNGHTAIGRLAVLCVACLCRLSFFLGPVELSWAHVSRGACCDMRSARRAGRRRPLCSASSSATRALSVYCDCLCVARTARRVRPHAGLGARCRA